MTYQKYQGEDLTTRPVAALTPAAPVYRACPDSDACVAKDACAGRCNQLEDANYVFEQVPAVSN